MLLPLMLIIPLLVAFIAALMPAHNEKHPLNYKANDYKVLVFLALVLNLIIAEIIFILFDFSSNQYQFVQESYEIGWFNLYLGVDGLSIYFVLLTTIIMPITMLSNWYTVLTNEKWYLIIILLLETLLLAVFLMLDIFLFYIFFESILPPLFLLIGMFGSNNKVRASFYLIIKFLSSLARNVSLALRLAASNLKRSFAFRFEFFFFFIIFINLINFILILICFYIFVKPFIVENEQLFTYIILGFFIVLGLLTLSANKWMFKNNWLDSIANTQAFIIIFWFISLIIFKLIMFFINLAGRIFIDLQNFTALLVNSNSLLDITFFEVPWLVVCCLTLFLLLSIDITFEYIAEMCIKFFVFVLKCIRFLLYNWGLIYILILAIHITALTINFSICLVEVFSKLDICNNLSVMSLAQYTDNYLILSNIFEDIIRYIEYDRITWGQGAGGGGNGNDPSSLISIITYYLNNSDTFMEEIVNSANRLYIDNTMLEGLVAENPDFILDTNPVEVYYLGFMSCECYVEDFSFYAEKGPFSGFVEDNELYLVHKSLWQNYPIVRGYMDMAAWHDRVDSSLETCDVRAKYQDFIRFNCIYKGRSGLNPVAFFEAYEIVQTNLYCNFDQWHTDLLREKPDSLKTEWANILKDVHFHYLHYYGKLPEELYNSENILDEEFEFWFDSVIRQMNLEKSFMFNSMEQAKCKKLIPIILMHHEYLNEFNDIYLHANEIFSSSEPVGESNPFSDLYLNADLIFSSSEPVGESNPFSDLYLNADLIFSEYADEENPFLDLYLNADEIFN